MTEKDVAAKIAQRVATYLSNVTKEEFNVVQKGEYGGHPQYHVMRQKGFRRLAISVSGEGQERNLDIKGIVSNYRVKIGEIAKEEWGDD